MVKSLIKIKSVIIIVSFLLLPAGNLFAQAIITSDSTIYDPVHQFLWFNGHWNPKNKKQFIIDKDSSVNGGIGSPGGTIVIEPDGSVRLQTGGITEWNKKMDEALNVIDKWDNNLVHPASADLSTYDLNQLLLPEVKADKATYTNYKIDPNTNVLDPGEEKKAMGTLVSKVASEFQKLKPSYDNIMAFWKAHKKDKDADLNIPPPPEFTYDCYACDSNLRKIKDTLIERYLKDFFHPEDSLVQIGLNTIRSFALMGIGPASEGTDKEFEPILNLFHTDKKDPAKSGPCSYLDFYLLENAIKDISFHAYRRSQELLRRYRKDFRAAEAITRVSLTGVRDWALFSGNCNEDNALSQLAYLVGENIRFYMDKLKQHDWKQLANVPFIIGMMRQQALLAGDNEDAEFKEFCSILTNIMNKFHLSIDMDIKVGKDGGYMLTHLKGETKIAIDFVQDQNQCYRWVAAEDAPVELFEGLKQPVKKMLQKIDMDLLANQIMAPSPLVPVYAGTKKYYVLLKNLEMDYCHPGDDSIIVSTFVPSPNALAGTWTIPNSKPAALGINGLDHFFQDEEKMQELVESGQAQASSADMQRNAEELKTKMQALARQMGNGKNKDNLQKYIELQKMATQSQDLGNNTNISPMVAMAFQIPVQNDITLVDKKFDAKALNPKQAGVIVYGFYTVKIEYRK